MLNLYDRNGLIFWNEEQIKIRQMIVDRMVFVIGRNLKKQNRAFEIFQCEAPILTPLENINPNYVNKDMFNLSGVNLVCRPETTMGSYEYAKYLLSHHTGTKLPICVWQHGKSFRREQDQPQKHMRLKEFYQLEFQCLYSVTTAKDYSEELIQVVWAELHKLIGPCKTDLSDRIPDYAEWTKDIIFCRNQMELCSISKRKDFKDASDISHHCLEVAIGTDRCMVNYLDMIF